jgi:cell division cycle 20-like protein 1 (cofactor of APC complex)
MISDLYKKYIMFEAPANIKDKNIEAFQNNNIFKYT